MGFLSTAISSLASSNPIGAAISGGVSLLGGLLGNKSQSQMIDKQIAAQKEENQKNRDYNLMLAQQQNAWNQEQWERENDYNTPEAQMERLKQAGLNPDLAYGGQNVAASSPMMTSGAPSNPTDMSALGQKPTVGQAVQTALRDSMIGAQIENIKADTKKKLNESDIFASDAKFRDALNQGKLELNNSTISLNSSNISINEEQSLEIKAKVRNIDQQTTNLVAEYDKIRSTIRNLDSDTALRDLHRVIDSEKAKAEIERMAAATALDFAQAKEIATLLSAKLLGLQATASMQIASGLKMTAETNRIDWDLQQDQSFQDIERSTNIVTDICDFMLPIAQLVGTALGGDSYETYHNTTVHKDGRISESYGSKRKGVKRK